MQVLKVDRHLVKQFTNVEVFFTKFKGLTMSLYYEPVKFSLLVLYFFDMLAPFFISVLIHVALECQIL